VTNNHSRPVRGHIEEQTPSPISRHAANILGRLYQSLYKTDPMIEICAQCDSSYLQAHAHHAKALQIACELAKLAGFDLAELRRNASSTYVRPGSTKADKLRRTLRITELRRQLVRRLFKSLKEENRVNKKDGVLEQESLFFVEILNEAEMHLEHCYKILFSHPKDRKQIHKPRRAPKTTGHQRIMIAETISRIRPAQDPPPN